MGLRSIGCSWSAADGLLVEGPPGAILLLAALVGMRGWDPGEYTEHAVGSLLAELVAGAGAGTRPVRDK